MRHRFARQPLLAALCLTVLVLLKPAFAEPALYQVDGEHGRLYLFGTVHALPPDVLPLPDRIMNALAASDALVLELDLQELDPASLGALTMQRGMYLSGEGLRSRVSPEVWDQIQQLARRHGLPTAMLDRMRPWLAGLTLTMAELASLGVTPDQGVDLYLAEEARKLGVRFRALETADAQLSALADLPERSQIRMLEESLAEMQRLEAEFDDLLAAWQSGELARVEGMAEQWIRADEAIYQAIIVDRHARWVPKLERILEDGETAFVAIGALHLTGEDGLVELLRSRGYRVTSR
ncbi:MAG: TraB/GumN family protein [Ectothiorhodospiraceae bacterium]|nr:TraB/GumN family protein [Ectothiorhodospiraceae bacterium]